MTFEELPPMEHSCTTCSGTGQVPWIYETKVGKKLKKVNSKKTCDKCSGRGKLLTEFGLALVNLMKTWNPWDEEIQNLRDDIRSLEPYDRQRD
jgi:hypothetical protein